MTDSFYTCFTLTDNMDVETVGFIPQKSFINNWTYDDEVFLPTFYLVSCQGTYAIDKLHGLIKDICFDYSNKARHGFNSHSHVRKFHCVVQRRKSRKVNYTPSSI